MKPKIHYSRNGVFERFRFTFKDGRALSAIRGPGTYGCEKGLWETLTLFEGESFTEPEGYKTWEEVISQLKRMEEEG